MSARTFDLTRADPEVVRMITPALMVQPRHRRAVGWSMARWMVGAAALSLATNFLLMWEKPNSWIGPVVGSLIYLVALAAAFRSAQQGMRASVTDATEGRLAHARGLAPGLARIEAQQEVIYQTLAAAETSLRRLQAAPAEPALERVEEIRRSTAQVTAQTRAVEEAVQEVVALGAG